MGSAFLIAAFLIFAIFSLDFIIYFLKRFKNKLAISLVLSMAFLWSSIQFDKLWPFFSGIVAKAVYFLLGLFFQNPIYIAKDSAPIVGIPAVSAEIHAPCSGLEGMGLFIFLQAFDHNT